MIHWIPITTTSTKIPFLKNISTAGSLLTKISALMMSLISKSRATNVGSFIPDGIITLNSKNNQYAN